MLKILDSNKENIIISVSIGKFNKEDAKKLIESLEEKAKKHQTIRWYFELEDVVDISENFSFTSSINFEKIAMVGKKENRSLATSLTKDLNSDIRFFELQDQEEAHKWINQD